MTLFSNHCSNCDTEEAMQRRATKKEASKKRDFDGICTQTRKLFAITEKRVTRTANTKESKGTRRAGFKVKRDSLEIQRCTVIDQKRDNLTQDLQALGADSKTRRNILRAHKAGKVDVVEKLLKGLTD